MRLIDADAYVYSGDLENEPTIDPITHGKWEEIATGHGALDYCFRCSNCRGNTPDKAYPVAPNFCPHCGAKMDLEG